MAYRYKKALHFFYEKSNRPFFGPWTKAYEALQKVKIQPALEEEYLEYIEKEVPDIYEMIEWVRFHNFTWKEKGSKKRAFNNFNFRLAVTYTKPLPEIRDKLFEIREKVTCDTGWYPLVMGSRALISKPKYRIMQKKLRIMPRFKNIDTFIGKLKSIRDISNCHESNCFLLNGTEGSILFDTGFGINYNGIENLKTVFLSHFHKDHTYGIWDLIEKKQVPIVLSEVTLTYLLSLKIINLEAKKTLLEQACVLESPNTKIDSNCSINTIPVFHAPGSYGYIYNDKNECSVIYLGDVCLNNGFYNFSEQIAKIILNLDSRNKWVILDASMVGKSDLSICDEDTPKLLLQEISSDVSKRNVLFISSSPEMLIYSYIYSFLITRTSELKIKLVLNDDLFDLVKTLWGSFILKDRGYVDLYVKAVLGKNKSDFVESFRVYPLSTLGKISKDDNVIAFITPVDITKNHLLEDRIKKADIFLAGTLALRSDIPEELVKAKPRSIIRVASPDWSFHSSEADLKEFINILSSNGIKTILFHNYSKVLKKFLKNNNFDPKMVQIISRDGINLQ